MIDKGIHLYHERMSSNRMQLTLRYKLCRFLRMCMRHHLLHSDIYCWPINVLCIISMRGPNASKTHLNQTYKVADNGCHSQTLRFHIFVYSVDEKQLVGVTKLVTPIDNSPALLVQIAPTHHFSIARTSE